MAHTLTIDLPPPEFPRPERPDPRHNARQLTGSAGQAEIVLDDQIYRLRITRAGKLILTK